MGWASERTSIEERLEANWTTTPIGYDNVDFEPPASDPWIRLTILTGESVYKDTAQGKEFTGHIIIQIFVPENTGTETIRSHADSLAAVFDSASFDGIVCRETKCTRVGNNHGWYQMNVSTPFSRSS